MEIIKVGFDLDGVIAQHPLGGFWYYLRKAKEKLLKKVGKKNYYYPQTPLEKEAWRVIDWLRPPLKEKKLLLSLGQNRDYQLYLITGRFSFLKNLTLKWLKKNQLFSCFKKIFLNTKNLNPQRFKAQKINQLGLDYFIDDDPETVAYLRQKTSAKIFLKKSSPRGLEKLLQSLTAD